MSEGPLNPYAPGELPATADNLSKSESDPLAGRLTRFAAAFLDGILLQLIVVPVEFATGFFARSQAQTVGVAEQLAMSLLGWVVFLVFNGYLLAARGQTIGKAALSIQIVDFESGRLLPFVRVYVYRYLWTLPLVLVVIFIPGGLDNSLISFVILVDILMIFRRDRRCLHDLIAGSKVVTYRADR